MRRPIVGFVGVALLFTCLYRGQCDEYCWVSRPNTECDVLITHCSGKVCEGATGEGGSCGTAFMVDSTTEFDRFNYAEQLKHPGFKSFSAGKEVVCGIRIRCTCEFDCDDFEGNHIFRCTKDNPNGVWKQADMTLEDLCNVTVVPEGS